MRIFAYIDPGLGLLVWQTIVAAFVGFIFYVKKTRRWILNQFRRIFGAKPKEAKAPEQSETGVQTGS